MNLFHHDMVDRWPMFSIHEQMAHIGAEVGRAITWRSKNANMSMNAFCRALELIDFTAKDPKNNNSLKEIIRMREALADYFFGDNMYHSTDASWEKYFFYFNVAARKGL